MSSEVEQLRDELRKARTVKEHEDALEAAGTYATAHPNDDLEGLLASIHVADMMLAAMRSSTNSREAPMLTTDRMQAIMVDVEVGRDRKGYTPEENRFRDKIEAEINEIHARGKSVEFTSELP